MSYNELQNLQISHVWPFTKHLKNPMHWDIFRFLNICVCWNVTTLTLTPIFFKIHEHLIWMNPTSHIHEWTHLQHSWLKYFEMPKKIFFYQTFNHRSWKVWPVKGVWLISYEFFYSLIRCSLLSECLMIGIVALLWYNKKESLT